MCRIGKDFKDPTALNQYISNHTVLIEHPHEMPWVAYLPSEYALIKKIAAQGVALEDWDVTINYGIKTGYNPAFIIDGKKRAELISEDPKSAEVIRPILRGEDVKAFVPAFADLWLVFIPWHFPLQDDPKVKGSSVEAEKAFSKQYKAVYKYLLSHKEKLSARNQAETGIRYEWYALQRWASNYYKDFDKPKIIYPNMTAFLPFVYDENDGYMCNDKAFILTGEHLKYLTGVLNSSLWKFAFKDRFPELLGNAKEVRKVFFEKVPVMKPTGNYEPLISALTDKIIAHKKANKKIDTELQTLDVVVYRMYNLTHAEVLVIDPAFGLSEEEYNRFKVG
jgi:hypothetical protein